MKFFENELYPGENRDCALFYNTVRAKHTGEIIKTLEGFLPEGKSEEFYHGAVTAAQTTALVVQRSLAAGDAVDPESVVIAVAFSALARIAQIREDDAVLAEETLEEKVTI